MKRKNVIQVFEHMPLRLNDVVDGVTFNENHLKAFKSYYGKQGCPYFTLINDGIKFTQYVGVIQVNNLTIEVLPKTDRGEENKSAWHGFLIDMLRTVGFLDVYDTSTSSLRLKGNSILDLYMELFLKEVRYLLQTGIIKKYRKAEGNSYALKGTLLFGKNIQQNLVHAERFYVRYTTYDKDNIFNKVLYKTLHLVKQINTSPLLTATVENLLLDFPECKNIAASDTLFNNLAFDRKSESYRKAINMARLLLLNYHPDIRTGLNDVLALMFNMNKLWEAYVYKILKKKLAGKYLVKDQLGSDFWQPENGRVVRIYPDIVVYDISGSSKITVLDTKWKNISGTKPSDDDLKQMLVYNLYYDCKHSALLYPATYQSGVLGNYHINSHGSCSLLFIKLEKGDFTYSLRLNEVESYIDKIKNRILSAVDGA